MQDMQDRVDEGQTEAIKGGKKVMSSRPLTYGGHPHQGARVWDVSREQTQRWQPEEPLQDHERIKGLIDQSYKEQIVEAEDIAGLNLGKLRQVQSDLYSSHCGHIMLILT